MDNARFDRMTRAFAAGLSRRGMIGGMLAAAVPAAASAGKKGKGKGKRPYRPCDESEAVAGGAHHHCDFRKARFAGRDLHGADFRSANLRHADFRGANLRDADFSVHTDNARYGYANTGADLTGANFDGADLTGANFDGAVGMDVDTCMAGIVCDGRCFQNDCSPYGLQQCCGGQPYNSYGNIVCGKQLCCDGAVTTGDACCGTVGYDPRSQACCNGVVKDGTACCGANGYDPSTHVCCQGFVRTGKACCGVNGYDPATHVCCSGIVCAPGQQCCSNNLQHYCGACG